jgi:deoxyribonuclease-1
MGSTGRLAWLALAVTGIGCAGEVPARTGSQPTVAQATVARPTKASLQARPTASRSFSAAKRVAHGEVYFDHRVDLYCDCRFDEERVLDAGRCGYRPRNDNVRARRIEWEHVVPAARLGRARACWGEVSRGRRRHCARTDPTFAAMVGDLHNLVPAVGELNGDRRDFGFGEVPGEPRAYGACDFEVDFTRDVAEPAEGIRGDLARAYLYMEAAWGLELSPDERAVYLAWHEGDPPSPWERERNRRITAAQGNVNRWVETGAPAVSGPER